jgi:DNA-binding PucR family transcriptional regulator
LLDRGDAEVLALVAGHVDADAPAAVTAVLGELLMGSNEHLLMTLDAFIAAGGAAEAAELLHLHAQTVRYRLRRVAALTGRDLRSPWDRFVLQAARVATVPG